MNRRLLLVGLLLGAGFCAVVVRLVDIMIVNHGWFLSKARSQHIAREAFPVKRGIIVDRRGRELAINLETESVFADPAEVESPESVAATLGRTIKKKDEAILAKVEGRGRFNWIERKVDVETADSIRNLKLKGVGLLPDTRRFYPKGSLASHIVGFVDIDNNGLEGVEKYYEKHLTTKASSRYVSRDAKGNVFSEGGKKELKGNNVVLTIDEGLQYIVEKNLDEAMRQWRAASATAVMMDPHTGAVLAMASRPTYDPNNPSEVSPEQRRNRAVTDTYEPGSTFKIIAGTAALQEGLVRPDRKFDCSAGAIDVGGNRIRDVHRYGVLTFREIIQKSSNVGTIKVGLMLGKERMYEYIKKFGFGEKTGIDLIGEVPGKVRHVSRWSAMSIGAISIGQELTVTPLQMLRAYAVVANGGLLVTPHIVAEVRTPAGETVYKTQHDAVRILSEETSATFREILKTVTETGGTAKSAAVDGNEVAGKTGTAQKVDPRTKRYSKDKFVGSFVGFVPADSPRFVLVVIVNEPRGQHYGGVVAAPVFRHISEEALSYLNIPRDDSEEKGLVRVSHDLRRPGGH